MFRREFWAYPTHPIAPMATWSHAQFPLYPKLPTTQVLPRAYDPPQLASAARVPLQQITGSVVTLAAHGYEDGRPD